MNKKIKALILALVISFGLSNKMFAYQNQTDEEAIVTLVGWTIAALVAIPAFVFHVKYQEEERVRQQNESREFFFVCSAILASVAIPVVVIVAIMAKKAEEQRLKFAKFITAIEKKDIEKLKQLFKTESIKDINMVDKNGDTLLHWACKEKKWDIAKLLISKNINIDTKNDDGYTPFHFACLYSGSEVARLLIYKGADINTARNDGFSALHHACWNNNIEMAKFLIKSGASVNITDNTFKTPLYYACSKGFLDMIKFLIKNGATINYETEIELSKLPLRQKILSLS